MNSGVIQKPRRKSDYIGGATPVINPSGDWSAYLPLKEYQNRGLETMACVSFSALNCLEILSNFKYKENINWSDRFLAKMSGTTHRGNWLTNVGDSIRHNGLVLEKDYPSVWTTWEEYYKEITPELKTKAKDFLLKYQVNYSWIVPTNADSLENALKITPIQVIVHAWGNQVNGIYQRTEAPLNHAVVLINAVHGQYWEIFDSYEGFVKKLAWDFIIQDGFQYNLTKKNMKFVKEKNKPDVYLVKGNEIFPINSGKDYLNLEKDWSPVIEMDSLENYTKVNKKLYVFLR